MGKITVVDIVLRLLGAVIVGFAVGAQRARTSHPAGIRTHILVALGSCVVMVTSCIMYEQTIAVFGTTPSDPARLGAQVINGIGFLGAGTILVTGRQQVKGLTTAAGLWASACTGLAVGAGFYECVLLGFLLILLTNRLLPFVEDAIIESARNMNIYVEFQTLDNLGDIIARIKSQGGQIYEVDLDRGREERSKNPSAVFSIRLPGRHYHVRVLAAISELESVYTIDEI